MTTSTEPSTEPISASALRAALDIRVAVTRLRRRMREVSAGELTAAQASVLSRLASGEAATAASLALHEQVRPQSMAATLAALEQLGLVARSPDPRDGRRQLVELTDAGRERHRGDREARDAWLTRSLQEHLTEEERQTVLAAMALLERLVRA